MLAPIQTVCERELLGKQAKQALIVTCNTMAAASMRPEGDAEIATTRAATRAAMAATCAVFTSGRVR